ncbi:peptide chain release factor 1 [bacterium]|nr:peptide chain release factor 1 [bacterium]
MFERFIEIEEKYKEIERRISDPEVIANLELYQDLLKKHSELSEPVATYHRYKNLHVELDLATELLKDADYKEMAKAEIDDINRQLDEVNTQLQLHLIPSDPNDQKNAMVEIRSGTGGDEAALFAADLFRMYTRYADRKGWKLEILSDNSTGIGGLKEISFSIAGRGVFSRLKFESGTHRVQRVPDTEASGRVHTSAATVAILPEAEEVDVKIDQKDLRIDTFRASGAGGQHVNKTSSAIRITHVPTNTVVVCQDERSQFQNKDKAMRMLRTRLYEAQLEAQRNEEASLRKGQVGSGDRSEKIRTYNFPQNRVTDHRINLSVHNLDEVLDGKLDEILDGLISADRLAKLANG